MTYIPLFDPAREYGRHAAELDEAARRTLASGQYILGPEVRAFEQDCTAYLGVRHAIGVSSGTEALWLSLRALGVGVGDAVLTTPFTFFATASAILNAGATPVFADIDPDTWNIDPVSADAVLSGKSTPQRCVGVRPESIKVILPVHLYGQPAQMDQLLEVARSRDLACIEDAAQAFGARYGVASAGTLGDLGCFSFFPTKNLGAFGDGGLIATNEDELADRLRMLRAHGSKQKYVHQLVGTNGRLDELQAALLRVKLRYLDEDLERRRELADRYDEALREAGVGRPVRAPGRMHSFNIYTISAKDRDGLRMHLESNGIDSAVYYPIPLHLQPALTALGYVEGDFPVAEAASREVLSLPMFPQLSFEEVYRVAAVVGAVRSAV